MAFEKQGGQDGAKGCVRALGARPPYPRTDPETTPLPYTNGQNLSKMDVQGVARWSWPNIFADGYGSRSEINSWHGENEASLLYSSSYGHHKLIQLQWKKSSRKNFPEFSRKHKNTYDTTVQSWRNSNLSSRPFVTRTKLAFTLHMNPEATDHHCELHVENSILCRPASSDLIFPVGDLERACES